MSSTRIPTNAVNYTNLVPSSVQNPVDLLDQQSSTNTSSSSTVPAVPASTVNIFDAKTRQQAAQSLLSMLQASGNTLSLPSLGQISSDDSSDDSSSNFIGSGGSSGQSSGWAAGLAQLPESLQNVPESAQPALNAAAANIASAVFSTPVEQLKAYNQQVASGQVSPLSGLGSTGVANSGLSASGGLTATGTNTATAGLNATNSGVVVTNQTAPTLQGALAAATTQFNTSISSGNIDQSVAAVSMMGVLGLQQQLTNYAQHVQNNNNIENELSTDNQELMQAVANWPPGTSTQTFTWHEINQNGQVVTQTAALTQSQAQAVQTTVQDQLQSMQSQSQTDQLNLQNMAQQYQEGITTISNMLSMQYNTLKNTLQNIHY